MRKYQSILTFLLLFLSLTLLLEFFGIINFSSGEIIGYALILYGISDVYLSLGRNRKYSLFFGTVFFLVGILLFVLNNFIVFWGPMLLLPTALFIPGAAYLMLYLDNPSNKRFPVIGIVLVTAGLIAIILNGQFNFTSFYNSLLKIATIYWQIVLLIALILILISFEERK